MFKLVVVGGKLRGKEYILNDGENTIGRSADCDHVVSVEGISKKHLQVTVNGETAFAEDMGSSNGTLVNGKIIKRITIKDGDKIALPNLILQVVYVLEKKIIIKKRVLRAGESDDDAYDDLNQIEPMPQSLIAKPIWFFKYKVMPVIYSFNEQYEWAALVGILLFVFIAINISLTILPVLRDSKILLIKEIALRGKQYAAEVDRLNNVYIRDKNLDQVYTGFLEGADAEGVQSYRLFDLEGRVYRPVSELNTFVNDPFSVEAKNFYSNEKNQDREVIQDLGNNTIGIARAIKAHDRNLGRDVVVAIITIRFSPTSLAREASNNSKAYLESLITSAMVAIFFFGMLYYMTIRPLDEMRLQIERVLRGRQKELESRSLFREIHPLRNSINSILMRIKELQNTDSGESQSMEEDGPYLRSLKEFMAGAQGPVMILNSEKVIQHINPEAEDLIGIRENASAGQSILDTARDQGFAATVIDLCDQSANNEGCNQRESYEIGGKDMYINVAALIGKDKFAKGFYITFVRND
ncbi:FHA domain-containing protein [Peredibacter sp. HCB2-198]|uniref:FHA domain-containing protein n=1 Tax=Peredibacter sp. HCB2-198 TaxID=3383025 RepID=UPI0038B4419D